MNDENQTFDEVPPVDEAQLEKEETLSTLYPDDATQPEVEAEPEVPEQPQAAPEPPQVDMSDGLTAAEVAERDRIKAEAQKLQAFDAALAQKYGGNLNEIQRQISELEKTDKARAVAMRSDLRDQLTARQQFAQKVQADAQAFDRSVIERRHTAAHQAGRNKLLEEVPALSDPAEVKAFSAHLLSKYRQEELEACTDHRPLVAEYRAWKAASPTRTKKVPRKKARGAPAQKKFRSTEEHRAAAQREADRLGLRNSLGGPYHISTRGVEANEFYDLSSVDNVRKQAKAQNLNKRKHDPDDFSDTAAILYPDMI